MSKFNLNSIISWVDSHTIDYPTAMNILRRNRVLFFVCFLTFVSTILISPFTTFFFLAFLTLYFLYKGEYKNIFYTWFFFFFNWYLIFTFFFIDLDYPILIGKDHTGLIFYHLLIYDFFFCFFRDFCLETAIGFHVIANYFGITIWIPSIFKGLLGFMKCIWGLVEYIFGKGRGGPSAECSPEKGSKGSPSGNSSPIPSPGVTPTDLKAKNGFAFNKAPDSKTLSKDAAFEASDIYKKDLESALKCGELHNQMKRMDSIWGSKRFVPMDDGSLIFGYKIQVPFFPFLGSSKGCAIIDGVIPKLLKKKPKDK